MNRTRSFGRHIGILVPLAMASALLAGCGANTAQTPKDELPPVADDPIVVAAAVTPEAISAVRLQYDNALKSNAVVATRPILGARLASLPEFRRWGVRETAVDALARIGEDAVPALEQTLRDPDPETRANAARALARMGPKAAPAVQVLIAALKDPNREVRQSAARALGQIGPAARAAVPELIDALRDPDTTSTPAFP